MKGLQLEFSFHGFTFKDSVKHRAEMGGQSKRKSVQYQHIFFITYRTQDNDSFHSICIVRRIVNCLQIVNYLQSVVTLYLKLSNLTHY